jgi:hypothetical protein
MMPPFGLLVREKIAGALMFLAGLLSLVLLIGRPETLVGHGLLQASRTALILQSSLVMLGAVGAFGGTLTAVALGTVSSLIPTGVGYLTFLPSLAVLVFAVPKYRSFFEFRARWTGPGRPPPGF